MGQLVTASEVAAVVAAGLGIDPNLMYEISFHWTSKLGNTPATLTLGFYIEDDQGQKVANALADYVLVPKRDTDNDGG